MRSSLPITRAAIERLRRSYWQSAGQLSTLEETRLIEEVGRTGEPNAVPVLLSFLFARSGLVAAIAADAIEQIVRRCTSTEFIKLDLMVRDVGDWQWVPIQPADVPRLCHGLTGVLGAIASHRNGRVREAAVRLLASTADGQELPFLLIRLNDWVREVRDAAKDAVLSRVRVDYAPHFARRLPLVFRLQCQSRENHGQVVDSILRLLRRAESRPALLATLAATDRSARRLAFGLLADAAGDPEDLVAHGLASEDEVVRLRAARFARERLTGAALERVLKQMLADRFMPVRREAVYGYAERLPLEAPAVLRTSLLDRHASMREAARFHLRQQGEVDFAAFYRSKLIGAAGGEWTAIAGLGETGETEDVGRVEPFLADPDPHIRRAAVRAMSRLDAECRTLEHFLTALEDNIPSVAKAARRVLRPCIYLVPPQRLWAMFTAARHPHSRRAILSLIAELGWWDSAPLLVAATGSNDEEVSRAALGFLSRWQRNINRLSVRPTRDQLFLLERAVGQHRAALDEKTLRDLEAHLSYATREFI